MKLVEMEIIPISLTGWGISPYESIIIKLKTDDGRVGLGEAPVFRSYLGDTEGHILDSLKTFWNVIRGKSPFEIASTHEKMDSLQKGPKAAKSAIDFALYDLVGKDLGQPVYKLLDGPYQTEFDLHAHAAAENIEGLVEKVKNLVKQGYAAVEVKLLRISKVAETGLTHKAINEEVEKLKRVLEAVDEEIQIVQDFNQFLVHPKMAINFLKKFEGAPNLWAEQPIYFENILGLAEIRRNVEIPIVADESAISPEQVMTMIRLGAADMFNIKLARVGGIYKARKIIAMAEAAGLKVKFDYIPTTVIGDTANGVLQSTVRRESRFPLSCDGHMRFNERPVKGGIELSKGMASLLNKPGLGCELDEEEIEKIRTQSSIILKN